MKTLTLVLISVVAGAAGCVATPNAPTQVAQAPKAPEIVNVGGAWSIVTQTPVGEVHGTMTNVQSGGTFNGKLETDRGNAEYTGIIEGNQMKFGYTTSTGMRFEYSAVVEGDVMKGKAAFADRGEGTWTATRKKQ